MTKIAIISDIHGNFEALKAVYRDMISRGVRRSFCLGDVVGYGPFPQNCLRIVKRTCEVVLKGNHEHYVCDQTNLERDLKSCAVAGVRFSAKQMEEADFAFLRTLSLTKVLIDLELSLAHGSFFEPEEFHYISDPEAAVAELERTPSRICIVGHTHVPYVFGSTKGLYEDLPNDLLLDKGEKFIINVGSVGQPRNGDCRASYGILEYQDNGAVRFNLHRVFYDISKTERAMKKANLPAWLQERLFRGE